MSKLLWQEEGWADYKFWIAQDKKILKKLDRLIEDISRNGNSGIGKPEPLTGDRTGWWSRRIDEQNRLVYRVPEDGIVEIGSCKGHYDGK